MSDSAKNQLPWLRVDRLSAITDGVVAIVLTILVLEIDVPPRAESGGVGFFALMGRMSHDIMVYFLSFSLIWAYWLQHHAIFHYIGRTDRTLIFLNGVFLFLLSLSPFTTELAGEYRGLVAADVVFGVNYMLSGVVLLIMWQYTVRNPYLMVKPTGKDVERSMNRRIMVAPVVALLGVCIAAFNFRLASAVFLAIPLFYLRHWIVDTRWREAA